MATSIAPTTTTAPESKLETWGIVLQILVLGLIFIGAVMGNTMVCLCIYLKHEMRSITAMFLANLAIADLGTGVFCLPMAIASVLDVSILQDETTCNLNAFCIVFFFITSINTMAATSVYKYWTVGFAMKSKVTRKHAILLIIVIWLISVTLAAGPIFGWNKYYFIEGRYQCQPKAPHKISEYTHVFALLLFGYALPVPLMTFCYARVYFISKNHFKRMKKNAITDINLLKSEAHLITTLWIVLIAFILCWLPFVVYLIAGILNKTIPFQLPIIAFTFGYSNSILNPLVYALRVKSFRKGFKDILLGRLKKKHSVPAYLTYKSDNNLISNNTTNANRKISRPKPVKRASIAYVLTGSNNKAFVLEEGVVARRKLSAYRISETKTYPVLSYGDISSRDKPLFATEDGSSVPQDKQNHSNNRETVAIIDQSRKKSSTSRRAVFEAAFPRLYPRISREELKDRKEIATESIDCVDGMMHANINDGLDDEEICSLENAQYNGGNELDDRIIETSLDKHVNVISLTETRTEKFTKVVNLCQSLEDKSPQGKYQITRHINTNYDIHVIINPTANEIKEFGSPCINKVLRTLTWEDVYFDSLGNKVMTKRQELAENEIMDVQELPLYMREHVRLEGRVLFSRK